jgi:hypothetical protein
MSALVVKKVPFNIQEVSDYFYLFGIYDLVTLHTLELNVNNFTYKQLLYYYVFIT